MNSTPNIRDVFRVVRNLLPLTAYPYRGKETACPVCGGFSCVAVSRIDRRLKQLPTFACDGCGLLFTNPMPTEDELEQYYRKHYRLDYQLVSGAPRERHVRKRTQEAKARADAIADLLAPGARCLDFGAGSGEFVLAMLERGFDAHGFDPGEGYASFARARLGDRIVTARWQEISHDGAFDLVTSFHVFEHLSDPLVAFRAAAQWVRPGGLVYVEVPDAVRYLRAKGFGSLHFAHVVGFNRCNLELAAAWAGLVPVRVIAPTCIVFRRTGETGDTSALAEAGAALTRETLAESSPGHAYLRHLLQKIGKRK